MKVHALNGTRNNFKFPGYLDDWLFWFLQPHSIDWVITLLFIQTYINLDEKRRLRSRLISISKIYKFSALVSTRLASIQNQCRLYTHILYLTLYLSNSIRYLTISSKFNSISYYIFQIQFDILLNLSNSIYVAFSAICSKRNHLEALKQGRWRSCPLGSCHGEVAIGKILLYLGYEETNSTFSQLCHSVESQELIFLTKSSYNQANHICRNFNAEAGKGNEFLSQTQIV